MVNHQLWSSVLKRDGRKVGRLRYKDSGWFKTLNYNQSVSGSRMVGWFSRRSGRFPSSSTGHRG
jgi:hypothetical protein